MGKQTSFLRVYSQLIKSMDVPHSQFSTAKLRAVECIWKVSHPDKEAGYLTLDRLWGEQEQGLIKI